MFEYNRLILLKKQLSYFQELLKRAHANHLACLGTYHTGDSKGAAGGDSLFVANHTY